MNRKRQFFLLPKLLIPAIFFVLLSSCGKSADTAKAIREMYNDMLCFDAQVKVTAELDDERQEYTLKWEHGEKKDRITVMEPEIISGISAEIDGETTELVYDGLRLALEPSLTVISPVEALPELWTDWSGNTYIDTGFELLDGENTVAVTYSHIKRNMELMQRVWFDCESLKPLKAELYTGERLAESIEFLYFDIRQE